MTDVAIQTPRIFGPGRPGAGYFGAFLCLILGGYFVYLGAEDVARGWERDHNGIVRFGLRWILAGLLVGGLAVVFARVPFTRSTIEVDETGVTVEAIGPMPITRRHYPWSGIDTIGMEIGQKGVQTFRMSLHPGHGRSSLMVTNVQLGEKPITVIREIAARAAASGFRLEGHGLREPFVGKRDWTMRAEDLAP